MTKTNENEDEQIDRHGFRVGQSGVNHRREQSGTVREISCSRRHGSDLMLDIF